MDSGVLILEPNKSFESFESFIIFTIDMMALFRNLGSVIKSIVWRNATKYTRSYLLVIFQKIKQLKQVWVFVCLYRIWQWNISLAK